MSFHEHSIRTEAVILRRIDFGETDFLVTLYTPRHGKLKAIAKGARKSLGRLTGHVELYAQTEMMLSRGRELHIITQSETKTSHIPFQENLELGVYASHFVELVDQFAYEGEENLPAYKLLVNSLNWLVEPTIDLRLVARYYEYQILRVMGFEPSVLQCAIGGEDLKAEDQFFSPVDGGVVCDGHTGGRDFIKISLPVFKILRHFSRSSWQVVKPFKLTDQHEQELERILHGYLIFLLEKRLQSAGFLKRLKRDFS